MKSVLTTLSLFILLFIFTVISSSALAQDSLVAFYPFSGSAEDSSGFAHHGAVYGATLTEDRFGYPNSAYEFDGYSNYIDIGNFEELRITGDLTVSVWLKSASFENFSNAILTYQADNTDSDSTSNALYKINFIDSSKLRYAHESGHGENSTHDFSNVTFETETWYHLILVRNISEKIISVYVNGELADSSSFELLPNGGESSTLKIGENHGTVSPERFFNGVLDDIRIYNIVLPDSAIYDLYTERGWPLPQDSTEIPNDTLIAHFPFNGNAEDESGFDNDGIVHGATLTADRFGNENSAYGFDGVDDYIVIKDDDLFTPLNQKMTISLWFKTKSPRDRFILYKGSSQYNREYAMGVRTDSLASFQINHQGDWLARSSVQSTAIIEEEVWYHLVGIWNGNKLKIYINSKLENIADTNLVIGNYNSDLYIGTYGGSIHHSMNQYALKGSIDDVRIYNYELDTLAVQNLYTEGGWPLPEDSTIVPNDTLAAHFPFNGNAEDESGYGNHGQVFGATLTEDRFGTPERAYAFDGIDDYILIENPTALHTAKNLSVSFWAKGTSNDTSFAGLITSPNMQPFGLAMNDKGRILFSISSESIPLNLVDSDMNIKPNDWHQYVAVYQANEYLKLFKDGNLSAALYGTIPGFMDIGSSGVYIGALSISYPGIEEISFFSGSIDDIRFYNHALTNEDINRLYEKERTIPVRTEVDLEFPSKFQLYQNYPNPFNPTTNISFDLPSTAVISLKVYDMTGRLIITLIDGRIPAGSHQITFDASQLASGVYLYELKGAGYSNIKKLTLIK